MRINKRFLLIWGNIVVILSLAGSNGCADSSETTFRVPSEILKQDTINLNRPITLKTDSSEDNNEVCITRKISWKPGSSESLLLDPQSDVIYPGNILDASSLQNGKFTPIVGSRKPITISISNRSVDTLVQTVDSATLSSIRKASAKILNSSNGKIGPAAITVDAYEIYDKSYLSLVLKSSYSGGFGKIEAGFNFNDESVKSRYLLDVTQIYYTIDVDAIAPDDFFNTKPSNISNVSPVYVSSVKFGRRILVAIESKKNIQNKSVDLKADLTLFSGKSSTSADATFQKLIDEKSIKLFVMGGNPKTGFKAFEAINDKQTLSDVLTRDAIWSDTTEGAPLAYTLRHCSDNSIFSVIQSGEYVARTCTIKSKSEMTFDNIRLENLCPDPRNNSGDDRDFDGDVSVTFSAEVFNKGNQIFCHATCTFQEIDGETAGKYDDTKLIATVPDNFIVDEITSQTVIHPFSFTIKKNGQASPAFGDRNSSPISTAVFTGDTPDDDDLSFDCNAFMHTGINSILFHPIKINGHPKKTLPTKQKA